MIEKEVIFKLIADNEKILSKKIEKRQYLKEGIKFLGYKEITVITGVRRSGKTYFVFELIQHLVKNKVPLNNILYINFEDERLSFIEPKDLEKIHEWFLEFNKPSGKIYFFLDEIQNVPKWQKWLSRSYENIKFIISGSNASLLSSELATAITGRYLKIEIYPFSFKEFVETKISYDKKTLYQTEKIALIKNYFKEYLKKGGFPEILLNNKKELLQQYYHDILFKDIITRYNIKYKESLEKIGLYLVTNISKTISLYELTRIMNSRGINTIKNYINYMKKAYLILTTNKFDYSLKKQIANPKKVYAIDTALARSVSFKFSEDFGRILENIAFIELKRRGKEVYYHKAKYECDFVIKQGLKITEAIQITKELNNENKGRELKGLIGAMKIYNLKKGLILTEEEEGELTEKGKKIIIKPIWKWLLE
ncbi:MAG: ATP-binding protein [Nanoarchaeota archaeon]|nr:ATP-binding protein [Nanoarchaeota archaeon]